MTNEMTDPTTILKAANLTYPGDYWGIDENGEVATLGLCGVEYATFNPFSGKPEGAADLLALEEVLAKQHNVYITWMRGEGWLWISPDDESLPFDTKPKAVEAAVAALESK